MHGAYKDRKQAAELERTVKGKYSPVRAAEMERAGRSCQAQDG